MCLRCRVYLRWTPQPVMVTIRDNSDYIRILVFSCCITITGWGGIQYSILKVVTIHAGSACGTSGMAVVETFKDPSLEMILFRSGKCLGALNPENM